MQPERRITNRIKRYVEGKGGLLFNIHGGDPYQEAGLPDLMGVYRGRALGIEVKQPGKEPSRRQLHILKKMEACGAAVCVAESVEDAVELLAKIDKTGGL